MKAKPLLTMLANLGGQALITVGNQLSKTPIETNPSDLRSSEPQDAPDLTDDTLTQTDTQSPAMDVTAQNSDYTQYHFVDDIPLGFLSLKDFCAGRGIALDRTVKSGLAVELVDLVRQKSLNIYRFNAGMVNYYPVAVLNECFIKKGYLLDEKTVNPQYCKFEQTTPNDYLTINEFVTAYQVKKSGVPFSVVGGHNRAIASLAKQTNTPTITKPVLKLRHKGRTETNGYRETLAYPVEFLITYFQKYPNISMTPPEQQVPNTTPAVVTPVSQAVILPLTAPDGLPAIVAHEKLGQAVNARELHTFLQSKQQFADWIKNRIDKYNFTDNEDYLVHKFMKGENTGFERIDYWLSVDMAKEICMLEANEKGQMARRYYIACEKALLSGNALSAPDNQVMGQLVALIERQNRALSDLSAQFECHASAIANLEWELGETKRLIERKGSEVLAQVKLTGEHSHTIVGLLENKSAEQHRQSHDLLGEVFKKVQACEDALTATPAPRYFDNPQSPARHSVIGFCALHKIKVKQTDKAIGMGLRTLAKQLGREHEIVKDVPHERFGMVNSYPDDLLTTYFTQQGCLL